MARPRRVRGVQRGNRPRPSIVCGGLGTPPRLRRGGAWPGSPHSPEQRAPVVAWMLLGIWRALTLEAPAWYLAWASQRKPSSIAWAICSCRLTYSCIWQGGARQGLGFEKVCLLPDARSRSGIRARLHPHLSRVHGLHKLVVCLPRIARLGDGLLAIRRHHCQKIVLLLQRCGVSMRGGGGSGLGSLGACPAGFHGGGFGVPPQTRSPFALQRRTAPWGLGVGPMHRLRPDHACREHLGRHRYFVAFRAQPRRWPMPRSGSSGKHS